MKSKVLLIIAMVCCTTMACEDLNTRQDTLYTEEQIASNFNTVRGFGYMAYTRLRHGFNILDNNLFAPASDEAEQTSSSSQVQLYNNGSWSPFNNPDDVYSYNYEGIRAANYFLKNYTNYKALLGINRDTLSDNGYQYHLDIEDVGWLYNENRVLRSFFYFDLLKRYGGVPLVTEPLSIDDNTDLQRASFDEIVEFIVTEIDAVSGDLQPDWGTFNQSLDGRLTQAAALSLKARTLLYAASPLYNSSNDAGKWQRAAEAAHDVIALNQFFLDDNYQSLFLTDNTAFSGETIWAIRIGTDNQLESMNYPIGTPGGGSGVTPSQNLVSAYEYKGVPDPADPFANRDPRLGFSIVTNGSVWNNRTIDISAGGTDAFTNQNASRTGYYLKKFLNDGLNLVQDETKLRSWIVFRYAEILLNYAEAMNEAYGPDSDNGWGMTARQAVNAVRNRSGVEMPPVAAASLQDMRDAIKHERRIELAFEDHRFWDLLRWKDAESFMNMPLLGVRATKKPDNSYEYTELVVEERVFIAPKMYFYPIPYAEIGKSNGILEQNSGW